MQIPLLRPDHRTDLSWRAICFKLCPSPYLQPGTFSFLAPVCDVIRRLEPVPRGIYCGALGWVTCQRSGSRVGTTSVWDRLDDGKYVSDFYLATPSKTTYSPPLPRC